jgi:hypothetical protein
VPVPDPAPVALNVIPTVLLGAPIATKLVVPREVILYSVPITKDQPVFVAYLPQQTLLLVDCA